MRVVLDTNILFSALISPHGPPDAIYRAWRLARFQLVTSDAQLAEIRRASRYPKFQSILQPARVGVTSRSNWAKDSKMFSSVIQPPVRRLREVYEHAVGIGSQGKLPARRPGLTEPASAVISSPAPGRNPRRLRPGGWPTA